MTDIELLSHSLSALTGEYGEIAKQLLVEELQKRVNRVDAQLEHSPASMRRKANAPWDDKDSY